MYNVVHAFGFPAFTMLQEQAGTQVKAERSTKYSIHFRNVDKAVASGREDISFLRVALSF